MAEDIIQNIKAALSALQTRRILYEANLNPIRPSDDALKKLDSSMKKNTALIRKLRQITEDTKRSILDDIGKTNQSKYVSEAAVALSEGTLKAKDIQAAVQICSALHQRYQDFSTELIPALCKLLQPTGGSKGGGGAPVEEDTKATAVRKRITLRLVVELLLSGVCSSHAALLNILTQAAAVDFHRDPEAGLTALSILTIFAKTGREDLLGLPRRPPAAIAADVIEKAEAGEENALHIAAALTEYEAEVALVPTIPEEIVQKYRAVVEKLFDSACSALERNHTSLVETERENERVLNNRGDLPESLATAYEAQRSSFEALHRAVSSLADVLDRSLPDLQAAVTRMTTDIAEPQGQVLEGATENGSTSPFEDEDSRAFYETLPDLTEVVPAVLLGRNAAARAAAGAAASENIDASDGGQPDDAITVAKETDITQKMSQVTIKESSDPEPTHMTVVPSAPVPAPAAADDVENDNEDDDDDATGDGSSSTANARDKAALDAVMSKLPGAVSRELCDELAVEFCYAGGAGKGARKRLAKVLSDPPAGALQLLPHYARVAAVLNPVFPDIVAPVVAYIEKEFNFLLRKKDATTRTLEPRVRCARYMAEMVKFKLFPAGTAFSLLKSLLDDFVGHNVDTACAFLEGAGRYLSRCPDTSTRMTNMLEVMMRLKNVKNLDARQAGLVESAYFSVKAADTAAPREAKPPQQQYIDHLVHERLSDDAVSQVLKKLRRLPWPEHERYVLNTLIDGIRNGRHSQLPQIASLAAGLAPFHPVIGVGIVDATLDDILAGLESPDAGFYQGRIAAVKFLGELYAYKLIGSSIIFSTLRLLFSFGHEPGISPEASAKLDPPGNFFRIRLVCALLESCGTFFTKGAARKHLDGFLPYLEMYILSKPPLPLDVDMDLQELYTKLKIEPPKYGSFAAASAAVAALEAKRASERDSGLRPIEEEEEADEEEDGIEEEEESVEEEESNVGSDSESSETDEEDDDSESSDSEEESTDDDSSSDESDLEIDVNIVRRPKTAEDEAFDLELAAALGETPSNVSTATLSSAPALKTKSSSSTVIKRPESASTETLAFHVLVRRGGREDRSKDTFQIPVSAGMVQHLKDKEAQEAAERAELKRLVLEADRRDEEEAGGMGGDRRGKYRQIYSTSRGRSYR